jgi:hypothetical protein
MVAVVAVVCMMEVNQVLLVLAVAEAEIYPLLVRAETELQTLVVVVAVVEAEEALFMATVVAEVLGLLFLDT